MAEESNQNDAFSGKNSHRRFAKLFLTSFIILAVYWSYSEQLPIWVYAQQLLFAAQLWCPEALAEAIFYLFTPFQLCYLAYLYFGTVKWAAEELRRREKEEKAKNQTK